MAFINKEDLKKVHDFLLSLLDEVYYPRLKEEAEKIATYEVRRIIYGELENEIRQRIREGVRTHVNVDVSVSLK